MSFDPISFDLGALTWVYLSEKEQLPPQAGLYFVRGRECEVLYVGQSVNIYQRWKNHHLYKEFVDHPDHPDHLHIAWDLVDDPTELRAREKALIAYLAPPYNGQSGRSRTIASTTESTWRQTTIRVDADLLRKARLFLDREAKSVNQFLIEQLEAYVKRCEHQQPEGLDPEYVPTHMVDTHIHMPEDLLEWCKRQPEGFAGLVRMLCTLERQRRQYAP